MGLYLPIKSRGSSAIAVCQRCGKKMYYTDLRKDPNTGLMVCEADLDLYDPWKLPARQVEDITLDHPRPDVKLTE